MYNNQPSALKCTTRPRQSHDRWQMVSWNPFGKIVSISVLSKYYARFKGKDQFHFVRLFTSAKPRPMRNNIWQYLMLDMVNINEYAKSHQNITYGSRDRTQIHIFRIWTLAKPRPMTNDIWQSLGLALININMSAIFFNILLEELWQIFAN